MEKKNRALPRGPGVSAGGRGEAHLRCWAAGGSGPRVAAGEGEARGAQAGLSPGLVFQGRSPFFSFSVFLFQNIFPKAI